MDWKYLDQALDIVGNQKNDIKTFLTIANTNFKSPDFNLVSYRIEEGSSAATTSQDTIYIVLRYPKDWQCTLDQLNSLRDFNRSKIVSLRIIPKEDPASCYIHVEWSKEAVVKNTKRKIDQ